MIHGLAMIAVVLVSASPDDSFFESKVRPVLAGVCVRCHGPQKASGGLRLDSREALIRGGKSGRVVDLDDPSESLLIEAIHRGEDVKPMPPDKPLSPAMVADLERWIRSGAPWPKASAPVVAARHWSFQPVHAVSPPAIPGLTPIDAFLTADRTKRGLTAARPTERRTLIRRASFDLTGLPPTPEETEAFVNDRSPMAFEHVIDRLLASPHYGEKWGRLWLDVAHYADTAGETADLPVPDAWRYRNYVIDAFNADKPYDQFLREQIAGDILAAELSGDAPPGRYGELISATGFIAIARRFGFDSTKDMFLTIDDTIDTFTKSVLGLTVGCARCHDHKYDPVSTKDYYALYGVFESTRYPFAGCEKDRVPKDNNSLRSLAETRRLLGPIEARVAEGEKGLAAAEAAVKREADRPSTAVVSGEIANGGTQAITATVAVAKGEMLRLAIGPKSGHGADSTLIEWKITEQGGAGRSWDLVRDVVPDAYQNGTGFQHDDSLGNPAVWHLWDASGTPRLLTEFVRDAERTKGLLCWRGSGDTPSAFVNINETPISFITVKQPARSVALHPGPKGAVVLAWESPVAATVALSGRVQDIDPSGGDGVSWTITRGPGLGRLLGKTVGVSKALNAAKRELDESTKSIPSAYAVAEGTPHNARVFIKGDPTTLGPEVPHRFIGILGGQPFASGSGRRELADRVVDPNNPLTARVMVNRVWQGHFGNGLVRTPDNFGVRGEPPTNPELLDWLTSRFVAGGWSIKELHRIVMRSNAYQSATIDDERAAKIDPDNASLWRFDRRRLTAEEIRDAMLAVSGDLDPTPGGPHPFPPASTWGFTQHNPFTAVYDHNRRSVYLMTQRIKRHPFLALFDGPDPNACTGRRDSTTVPTQALFYLNDPFVHARAESLAKRLASLPSDDARLDRAWRLLYGRPASAKELDVARRFLVPGGSGLAGWIRVMLASNEFTYID
jgi:hypothetical protein